MTKEGFIPCVKHNSPTFVGPQKTILMITFWRGAFVKMVCQSCLCLLHSLRVVLLERALATGGGSLQRSKTRRQFLLCQLYQYAPHVMVGEKGVLIDTVTHYAG